MAESVYRDTAADVDVETLLSLGAELRAGGFKLPPVTLGTVSLLDAIDSPFVTGTAEPKLIDLFRALYVVNAKQSAVQPILEAVRGTRALRDCQERGMSTPELAAVYLAAVTNSGRAWREFDARVAKFAEGLGQFDPLVAIAELRDALNRSTAGFAMIPKDGDAEKKTPARGTNTRQSGWRAVCQSLARLVTRRRRK